MSEEPKEESTVLAELKAEIAELKVINLNANQVIGANCEELQAIILKLNTRLQVATEALTFYADWSLDAQVAIKALERMEKI